MNKFIDDTFAKKSVIAVAQSNSEPIHIVSNTIPMNVVNQNNILEIAHPITPINNVTIETHRSITLEKHVEVLSDLLPIQKKTSK